MKKVILVILDGLNFATANYSMGYLLAECQEKRGHLRAINCELPSLSRPLYECILTGVKPVNSGIVNNHINRLSNQKSIFNYVQESELKAAAAAYYWISELYNSTPFNPILDRHVENRSLPIPFAHFYFDDNYPDSHLFLDAEHLRNQYSPDFLLVHSMNIDNAGHQYGLDSSEYRNTARNADMFLSSLIPLWIRDGYQVIITSDHGMNTDRSHGGNLVCEQSVPLFIFGNGHETLHNQDILQTDLCSLICQLLTIEQDKPSKKFF